MSTKPFDSGRSKKKPRSKKEMIVYLANHFRYSTMNSWNGNSSYALCVKLHKITFSNKDVEDAAWDAVFQEESQHVSDIEWVLENFAERHNHNWTIGFNGRSGGYLVLYESHRKKLGYKSFCPACGQRNYKKVFVPSPSSEDRLAALIIQYPNHQPKAFEQLDEAKSLGFFPGEISHLVTKLKRQGFPGDYSTDTLCGVCKHPRINLEHPIMTTEVSCAGVDMNTDYEDWTSDDLRARVDLIWDFDKTVEQAVAVFVDCCQELAKNPPEKEEDEAA